jgi:MOSC domain-containing protein YiiM
LDGREQQHPFIRSLNRGVAETFTAPDGKSMTSAVRKRPVDGPVRCGIDGLEGDGVSHPSHGGPWGALHAFPWDHYPWFEGRAGRALPPPAFGENLTVCAWTEKDVRIGDRVRIGTALARVTAPTKRCDTMGRSLGIPSLLDWIQDELRTGWYLAVEEAGTMERGDAIVPVDRGPEGLTVAALNDAMFRTIEDEERVELLLRQELISPPWRRSLVKMFRRTSGRDPRGTNQVPQGL